LLNLVMNVLYPYVHIIAVSMPQRILICEADQPTLEVLEHGLSGLECPLVCAREGSEALELVRSLKPDLLLLDMVLPDVDGLAVLKKLRSQDELRDLPVIAISGAADRDALEARLAEFAVVGILPKPVPEDDLRRMVRRGLAGWMDRDRDRVLLIVNQSQMRQPIMEDISAEVGLRPLWAADPADGEDLLDGHRPRAVVLALKSDFSDALPLLNSFVQRGWTVPTIAIAETVSPKTVERLASCGVRDIILKPINIQRLKQTLTQVLDATAEPRQLRTGRRSVLLVEDAALAAKMLRQLLEQGGCQVVCARSAESALPLIHEHKPELMLLDVILPGMDGSRLVQELHAASIRLPFAVVTGAAQTDKVSELRDLGAMHVFEKPVHSEDLLAFVDDFFA
jgi:DNA-binding NtrC family response regulator